jgi:hypothetical protein
VPIELKVYQTTTTIESDDRGLLEILNPDLIERVPTHQEAGALCDMLKLSKVRENSNWVRFSSFHKPFILNMFRIKRIAG